VNCGSVDAGSCIVWGSVPGSVVVVVVVLEVVVVGGGAVVDVVLEVVPAWVVGDDPVSSAATATPTPASATTSAATRDRRNRTWRGVMQCSAPFSASGARVSS
jgi:hypothetical protein